MLKYFSFVLLANETTRFSIIFQAFSSQKEIYKMVSVNLAADYW